MAAALQRERVPGDGAPTSGQEQGSKDLPRMVEDEGGCPLGHARLALRLGGTLLRRSYRRLAPHHGGEIQIVIRLVGKSFTQGDRSVFEG